MTNQNSTPEYVTREILKEEISASEARLVTKIDQIDVKARDVEKRLDAKIETTEQSLKEYTDSRFSQVVGSIKNLEQIVLQQGEKMTVYFNGIVKMVEGVTGKISIADDRLKDHEVRITVLEGRGPQRGRI